MRQRGERWRKREGQSEDRGGYGVSVKASPIIPSLLARDPIEIENSGIDTM